jgi:predicted GNAT superfamily acetyltransferase
MIDIRPLKQIAEFKQVVDLQRTVWGFAEVDLLPARLFVVADNVGGETLGAYDGERMVGFCLAIPGIKPGERYYWHSHMLGVLPEYQNKGVGRLLKLHQRERALAHQVDLIEWTFDPLELKNAFLNIERLGCVVRRYVHNQYGFTSSPLHGGLPTDRLVAESWLRSERSAAAARNGLALRPPIEDRVAIPSQIAALRRTDPAQARCIQQAASEHFEQCFSRGLAVVGFERGEDFGTYLLGRWDFK